MTWHEASVVDNLECLPHFYFLFFFVNINFKRECFPTIMLTWVHSILQRYYGKITPLFSMSFANSCLNKVLQFVVFVPTRIAHTTSSSNSLPLLITLTPYLFMNYAWIEYYLDLTFRSKSNLSNEITWITVLICLLWSPITFLVRSAIVLRYIPASWTSSGPSED